ncbi:hypothetical protein BDZ91DRAFT_255725 [Kalaharituber pfeilii]|nr:hypothetical protein BDZ91DRAFT_255725 [Kalaharituber pfeilii]
MLAKCETIVSVIYTICALFTPFVLSVGTPLISRTSGESEERSGGIWRGAGLQPRQKKEPLYWNDKAGNVIGVNEELGWDYDFCRMEWPRTAIVDGKLYIDSGTVWLSPKGEGKKVIQEINTRLFTLDLTQKMWWENYTLTVIPKPAHVPNVVTGEIFMPPHSNFTSSTNQKFYTYGGLFPMVNTSSSTFVEPDANRSGDIISYDVGTNKWEIVEPALGSDTVIWSESGTSISIPELGLGFYLGGYQSAASNRAIGTDEYLVVPGFLRLEWDLENPSAPPKWKNESVPFDQTIGGHLEYISGIGEKGILVKFGGVRATVGDKFRSSQLMNQMAVVFVYDIANAKWYQQSATGPTENGVPEGRAWGCSIMVPAKDNSSYNIYIYGGGGADRNAGGLDELWVLSLPSFTWIRAYSGIQPTIGASCQLLNDNFMMVIGPRTAMFKSTDWTAEECTPLWSVYDLTRGTWDSQFNPARKEKYAVRPEISIVIGGGGEGNATMKAPAKGWDDNALKALFEDKRGTGNETAPPTATDSEESSGTSQINKAAIIGGVVGALAIALLLILCCIHRQWRSHKIQGLTLFGSKPRHMLLRSGDKELARGPEELEGSGPVSYGSYEPVNYGGPYSDTPQPQSPQELNGGEQAGFTGGVEGAKSAAQAAPGGRGAMYELGQASPTGRAPEVRRPISGMRGPPVVRPGSSRFSEEF